MIYVATRRILAGVYDANTRVIGSLNQVELPVASEDELRLETLIDAGVRALAGAVLSLPDRQRYASAAALGLPVAMDVAGTTVSRYNSQRWNDVLAVGDRVSAKWEDCRRAASKAHRSLPDFPRSLDGKPAICVESDVALDTIAAMHPSLSGRLTTSLAKESVVLGVKYTGGIRSNVVTRGEPLRGLSTDRQVGLRRDVTYRGANGATTGLGHTVALVRSAALVPSDPSIGFVNAVDFASGLRSRRQSCSCGERDLTHLDSLVSARRLAERLDLTDEGSNLHDFWKHAQELAEQDTDRGRQALLVLEETGRLVGHAVDLAARLYDPSAVFVTGTLPYNRHIWSSLVAAFERASPAGGPARPIYRALDVEGQNAENDPIGPRGAAWLALDTFVYPEIVAHAGARLASAKRGANANR